MQLGLLPFRLLPLPERLLVVIDDSPTKRYGPYVEGAGVQTFRAHARGLLACGESDKLQVVNHPLL